MQIPLPFHSCLPLLSPNFPPKFVSGRLHPCEGIYTGLFKFPFSLLSQSAFTLSHMLKIGTGNFNDEPIEQDPASPWNITKPLLNLFRAVSLLRISSGAVIGPLGTFTDPVLVLSLASMLLQPLGLLNLLSKQKSIYSCTVTTEYRMWGRFNSSGNASISGLHV